MRGERAGGIDRVIDGSARGVEVVAGPTGDPQGARTGGDGDAQHPARIDAATRDGGAGIGRRVWQERGGGHRTLLHPDGVPGLGDRALGGAATAVQIPRRLYGRHARGGEIGARGHERGQRAEERLLDLFAVRRADAGHRPARRPIHAAFDREIEGMAGDHRVVVRLAADAAQHVVVGIAGRQWVEHRAREVPSVSGNQGGAGHGQVAALGVAGLQRAVAGRFIRKCGRDAEDIREPFVEGAGLAIGKAVEPGARRRDAVGQLVGDDVERGRERFDLDVAAEEVARRALAELHGAAAVGAARRAERRVDVVGAEDARGGGRDVRQPHWMGEQRDAQVRAVETLTAEALEDVVVVPAGVDLRVDHGAVGPDVVGAGGDIAGRRRLGAGVQRRHARQVALHVVGGDRRRPQTVVGDEGA